MVVVEAAAITAGSIAAYKGGKGAVTLTSKNIKTNVKHTRQENDRKKQLYARKEEREKRFSKINQYRESIKDVDKREEAMANFQWGNSVDANAHTKKSLWRQLFNKSG